MKILRPKEELLERMNWVRQVTPRGLKLVGFVELLGGLGLVLPALTGIAPILTPLAAIGLIVVMVCAIIVHARIKDPIGQIMPAVVLLLLLALCLWGLIAQGRV